MPDLDSPAPIEPGASAGATLPAGFGNAPPEPRRTVSAPIPDRPAMTCPACGFEQESAEECMKCGLVVAKYRSKPRPAADAAIQPGARSEDEIAADLAREGYEPRVPQSGAAEDDGFFAPERRGLDKGVLGGIAMMVIAVVWFGLGWMAGYIFFYPPILFVIGLFGLLKGMFTGNVAG